MRALPSGPKHFWIPHLLTPPPSQHRDFEGRWINIAVGFSGKQNLYSGNMKENNGIGCQTRREFCKENLSIGSEI
jgi:hypothetical protein